MTGWTIRVEEDEVEALGVRSGFTHTSIAIYDPSGARSSSVELVTGGGLFGGFNVTFQSASDRVVNDNPQSFATGLSQAQAQQLLDEAFSAAADAWTRGGGYELPPSVSINPNTNSTGIALGSGAFFPPEAYQKYFDDISGLNDPYIHNSNAFARLVHDQIVARANAYGYGRTNPIVDDIFGLPAPGWEYTERFGYLPNVPYVGAHCFLEDSSVQMWPLDPSIMPRADGSYDEELVLSKVWYKRQDQMQAGDLVVSPDKWGRLQPGRVTRTMTNTATHILDFWGTGVTPGHAYNCADGPLKGGFAPIMDILRMDGALMRSDGTIFRSTTNCDVGSMGDMMIHASATLQKPDGTWTEPKAGKVRFGTRIILPDGRHMSFMEMAASEGWRVSDDGCMVGMMKGENGEPQEQKFLFPYAYGEELPKPEAYILARSAVTLEDIYLANEWEQISTRMPAPDSLAGFNPNSTMKRTKPKPNIPPAFANRPDAPTAKNRAQRPASASPSAPGMNRKQRKAMEAKQRKAAKMRKRAAG